MEDPYDILAREIEEAIPGVRVHHSMCRDYHNAHRFVASDGQWDVAQLIALKLASDPKRRARLVGRVRDCYERGETT